MDVRLVMPTDRDAVRALAEEAQRESEPDLAFDEKVFDESFIRCIRGNPTCLVLECDDHILGFAVARIDGFYFASGISTSLDVIYVTPGSRGTRAPAFLLEAFLVWSDAVGARRKYAGINNALHPERTARFFEACGARRVGEYLAW